MKFYIFNDVKEITVSDLIQLKDILSIQLGFKDISFDDIIKHTSMISLCKERGEIIGLGVIKNNDNVKFKTNIFTLANRLDALDIHTHELGYLYTSPFHRKKGICSKIINSLCMSFYEVNPHGKLYATTKADNEQSISTLEKNLFQISKSKFGITNFVNIKSGNVLKLMLHKKKTFLFGEQTVEETPSDTTSDKNEEVDNDVIVVKKINEKATV